MVWSVPSGELATRPKAPGSSSPPPRTLYALRELPRHSLRRIEKQQMQRTGDNGRPVARLDRTAPLQVGRDEIKNVLNWDR